MFVGDVSSRAAGVTWYPAYDGNTPILGYLVQFWQTSGAGLSGRGGAGVRNVTVTGSSTSVTLTSLRPATEYQVQVSLYDLRYITDVMHAQLLILNCLT